jgi:hypothetical protein
VLGVDQHHVTLTTLKLLPVREQLVEIRLVDPILVLT